MATIAELTLSGSYRETDYQVRSLVRPSKRKTFLFDRFLIRCRTIRADRRVTRVLVNCDRSFTTGTVAALEEIRRELRTLVESGKEVVFFATEYRDDRLFLASACSKRILHPLGSLRCTGIARTSLFFRRLADRFGADVQVIRRGKYKSAADRFRLDTMDPANLEQYARWLALSAERMHEAICEGYGRPRADLDELLAGRLLDADAARESGWVDRTVPLDALRAEWREEKARTRRVKTRSHLGRGRRVAVLYFEGAIAEGDNSYNPLLGQMMGSDGFVKQVESLRKNRSIRSVVLRVNSGGGSAVASEDIRAALVRLAAKKPLVVSMGEVAGSGGYWIAMNGATVYALATTLTGSIGVLNLAVDLGETLSRQGITHATVRTHDHADAGGVFRPLSSEELDELDGQVDAIYERFLALVAEHRSLSRAEVDDRAQGRVWAGIDAHAQRLVDRIGGLTDAIDAARSLAGLRRARVDFYPRVKRGLVGRLLSGGVGPTAFDFAAVSGLAAVCGYPLLVDPIALLDNRIGHVFNADLQIE
jgi:protease IV